MVNSTHPQYDAMRRKQQRCRDAVNGSDAIKDRGVEYLPALSEQSANEYTAYKTRALVYGATPKTLQWLVGAIMRKAPVVTAPAALDDFLKNVTLTGISHDAFAKTILTEVLTTGRCGVLVDLPAADHDTQRPYLAVYVAESIVNWRTRVVHGLPLLDMVVLCEHLSQPKPDDPFTCEALTQYRVCQLNADGQYEVELFQENPNKKGKWVSQGVTIPTFRGQAFPYIPFCFFGPTTITPDIEAPPLLSLVDVQLSHFRSSADLEHGRHYCGLPTPVVSGISEKTTLKIGSSIAWVLPDPQAKAYMLEFTGQGLGELRMALEHKERLMAVLGARLLEEQQKTVQAADTLSMRFSGEQSVLRSVAGSVSTGLSKLLEWAAIWSGVKPEDAKTATVKLNTDFMDSQMSFAELESLVRSWQAGAISYDTMYALMEKGEVTRPGVDADDERQLISEQEPAALPGLVGLK